MEESIEQLTDKIFEVAQRYRDDPTLMLDHRVPLSLQSQVPLIGDVLYIRAAAWYVLGSDYQWDVLEVPGGGVDIRITKA